MIEDFPGLQPGDEVVAGGEAWKVTAVLFYQSSDAEWPAVKLARGTATTWAALEGERVIRYDPVSTQVDAEGRARWNGHTYTRDEMGSASIDRVLGDVDVRPGATLTYQVLRSADDPQSWISVESWTGGYVEISAGREWVVDRVLHSGERRP
ncbi:MAG TPA: DUF4178 domain-containing protein [Candidatus Methylomirabilis sp.]|nr:DUF4178 domain-containing protein [Candidatus Methylomirabilis sp.]